MAWQEWEGMRTVVSTMTTRSHTRFAPHIVCYISLYLNPFGILIESHPPGQYSQPPIGEFLKLYCFCGSWRHAAQSEPGVCLNYRKSWQMRPWTCGRISRSIAKSRSGMVSPPIGPRLLSPRAPLYIWPAGHKYDLSLTAQCGPVRICGWWPL